MDGVTILNEMVIYPDYAALGFCLFLCLGLFAGVVCLIRLAFSEQAVGPAAALCIMAAVILALSVFIISEMKKPEVTHYQVIIDDTVPMNEFFDKYEVIKQEGKIYTVKEISTNEK